MTRASLLHILDHVNEISDVEIRELEQLAAAFPYCQTAHVLLAKAAHDRGSMLAGQRLRRAATYAANRDLLRQLLESSAAVATPPLTVEPTVAPTTALEPAFAASINEQTLAPREDLTNAPVPRSPEAESDALVSAGEQLASEKSPELVAETPQAELSAEFELQPETVAPETTPDDEVSSASPLPELPATATAPDLAEAETEVAAPTEPELITTAPPDVPAVVLLPSALAPPVSEPAVAAEDLLLALAPPIRPPADAGISRFEFGLAQPAPPIPVAYQLPGLDEEDDDAELPTLSNLATTPPPVVTAPFHADADLGYALGAGSRLGYDLQAHDGYTLDLPLDAFFEPDALLLAHMQAHKPKPSASSFDLINRFLKAQPRIKTPAGVPLPAEEQPDLSVRSTSGAPALASESLAKIMVRQGKKDKAIEIYERLMERQPEKKAYFAEQIQQLQQPSE